MYPSGWMVVGSGTVGSCCQVDDRRPSLERQMAERRLEPSSYATVAESLSTETLDPWSEDFALRNLIAPAKCQIFLGSLSRSVKPAVLCFSSYVPANLPVYSVERQGPRPARTKRPGIRAVRTAAPWARKGSWSEGFYRSSCVAPSVSGRPATNLRCDSAIATSLMLASLRRIRPFSSNSHCSLPYARNHWPESLWYSY